MICSKKVNLGAYVMQRLKEVRISDSWGFESETDCSLGLGYETDVALLYPGMSSAHLPQV